MIIGNFRPGIGGYRKQRGFAHIGKAHQAHVGQKPQLQDHFPALSGQPCLGETGQLAGGRGKMLVAPAAAASSGQHKVPIAGHIGHNLFRLGIPHHRAPGDLNDQVFPSLTGAPASLAVAAGSGGVFPPVSEIHEGRQMIVHPQDYIASVTAVAAIRPSRRHIFLPVKRHRTVAALPGRDGNSHLIHKHKRASFWLQNHFASHASTSPSCLRSAQRLWTPQTRRRYKKGCCS